MDIETMRNTPLEDFLARLGACSHQTQGSRILVQVAVQG